MAREPIQRHSISLLDTVIIILAANQIVVTFRLTVEEPGPPPHPSYKSNMKDYNNPQLESQMKKLLRFIVYNPCKIKQRCRMATYMELQETNLKGRKDSGHLLSQHQHIHVDTLRGLHMKTSHHCKKTDYFASAGLQQCCSSLLQKEVGVSISTFPASLFCSSVAVLCNSQPQITPIPKRFPCTRL